MKLKTVNSKRALNSAHKLYIYMGVALTKLIVVASACILPSRDAVLLFFFSPQKALTSQTITESKDHLPLVYTSVLGIILTLPYQMKYNM